MPLSSGTRLGPYEVLAPIGAGGMGEVYKARDTRLDRVVAIKVLPPDKTIDAECRQRFLREARSASALNHPSIVTIYDIGSENGVDYIAMEFIAGKTIGQLIPRNGMRLAELLGFSAQTADALAKAHQAGIVHRDLKPSNIMVSSDGLVKVLDFGLAKLTQSVNQNDATQTMETLTGDGAVVGTVYYMSPEQVEAKPVDARSDIFSFGAMLYEMATGRRPFTGDSRAAVVSSILRAEPNSPGAIRGDLPAELTRILTRCLRKDPARRFQHMADLKVALEELRAESDSGSLAAAAPTPPRGSSRLWLWGALAVLVIAAGLTSWRVIGTSAPTAPVVYRPVPLTSYPGSQDDPSFSPDGTEIAFDWDGSNQDNFDIYVKLIGPGAPLRLTTDPAPDIDPRWSPDGRSIAFLRMTDDYTRFSVILIPALGGPERRLGTFANNASLASLPMESLCWTPDSKALVVSAAESAGKPNRLLLVPLDGEPKVLTHPNPDDTAFGDTRPSVSHDGRNLTFVRSAGGIYKALVVPVSSGMELRGEPHRLSIKEQVISHVDWLPGDREILVSAGGSGAEAQGLYRISTDQGAEERPVPGAGAASFSPAVSSRGNRLAYATGALDANFWSVDLATHASAMDRALSSSYRDVFPQFSPDGKRVVFYSNRSGSLQVWVANADGSQAGALTSMSGPVTGSPRWSPDGQQIAFDSNTGGAYHVYVIAGDGGQPRQVTRLRSFFANWSRDGRWIYFTSPASGDDQIWKAPATGGDPVQVTHGGGEGPVESVDGKALYFVRQNRGGGIWKMPVAGGDEDRVLKNEVYRVNYAVTDKGIYFTPRSARDGTSSVQFFSFASGKVIQIVKVAKLLDLGLGVSPDGRTLLYSQIDHTGSNLMLIESFH